MGIVFSALGSYSRFIKVMVFHLSQPPQVPVADDA